MDERYTIRLEPAGGIFSCGVDQTILDAAVESGYWLPHSCRSGTCGTCELTVLGGSVKRRTLPEGSVALEVPQGQCLSCQSYPTSDLVLDAPGVPAEPGRRVVKSMARILEVVRPSSDVAVVKAAIPVASGWDFKAGQYAEVVMRDGSRRSYSMANAPNDRGEIEWHIRRIEGGRFSPHAYDVLKPRDMLRIEGPFGDFTLREGAAPVILLASGTGYAPIAALLETHGDALAKRGAVLYWGGRKRTDLYAVPDVDAWHDRYPGVRLIPVFSNPDDAETGRSGFVHQAVLEDYPDLSSFEVYACGNPLMVDAAREAFESKAGLKAERFFSDAFVFKN